MKEETVSSISNLFLETSIAISQMDISEITSSLSASAAFIVCLAFVVSRSTSRASQIMAQVSKTITSRRPIAYLLAR